MIVVSNTSPLTNLAAIGRFDLLRALFTRVEIAEGVWHELNAGGRPHPGSREVEAAPWIARQPVADRALVRALQRDLDLGESETLALAVQLGADLVLVDEREGRRAAVRLGLQPLGVLGVLLRGKQEGLVAEVRPELEALRRRAGFFLSPELQQRVLALAGEEP